LRFKLAVLLSILLISNARSKADDTARVWPVPDWAVATPESQGVDAAKLDKLREYLEKQLTREALVIRHGRIVGEWYWRDATKDTKLQVYSVTKSISSTAVGLLIDDGKLKLEQSASDLIPAWKTDDRKNITIRQLVSMTSGIKLEQYDYFLSTDQLKKSLEQPLSSPPGTKWAYNNLACNCLSEIVPKASGLELSDFLQKRLYDPLGIKNVVMDKKAGRTLAYMGLNITARDLARIGYLFINKGTWNGKRILSENWIKQATSTSQSLTPGYGFLWWVHTNNKQTDEEPSDSYEAIGLYGNYLCVFPSQDMIVVRLVGTGSGQSSDVDRFEMKKLALAALKDSK
jgi:CubicO group peptidase (beta-lactamase class C family)